MMTAIPAALMRGGTSKGLYFDAKDLPADKGLRDKVLLAAMGSPDIRQIDGVGGAQHQARLVDAIGAAHPRAREEREARRDAGLRPSLRV